jgi:hypothetical protein
VGCVCAERNAQRAALEKHSLQQSNIKAQQRAPGRRAQVALRGVPRHAAAALVHHHNDLRGGLRVRAALVARRAVCRILRWITLSLRRVLRRVRVRLRRVRVRLRLLRRLRRLLHAERPKS